MQYEVLIKSRIMCEYHLDGLDVDYAIIEDAKEEWEEHVGNLIIKYLHPINVATAVLQDDQLDCIPSEGCTITSIHNTSIHNTIRERTYKYILYHTRVIVECTHEIDFKILEKYFSNVFYNNIINKIFFCGIDTMPITCQFNSSMCMMNKKNCPRITEVEIPYHLSINDIEIIVDILKPKCIITKSTLSMEVDEHIIKLPNEAAIDYFIGLYTKLDHKIILNS